MIGRQRRLAGFLGVAYGGAVLRGTIVGMLGLAGLGCGSEPTYAEFAEVCGEAGPVRVLELAPGERLVARPLKLGDRVVYTIGRGTPDESRQATPTSLPTSTVWTTGPCGEAPRKLVEEVDKVFTIAQRPGLLLACDAAAGEVLVLDPEGAVAPHVLFTGVPDCDDLSWTAHGLVSVVPIEVEGEEYPALGTLQIHRYPQDPHHDTVAVAPLLDGIRIQRTPGASSNHHFRVFPEFAFALTAEDELVRVDLGDGVVSLVQAGVVEFEADTVEGRYLLWQDATPTSSDPGYQAGKLFLRDRSDNTDVFLGESTLSLNYDALRNIELGVIILRLEMIRVFSLPDLGFVDLDLSNGFHYMVDERRLLSVNGYESIILVDIVSAEARTLYQGIVGRLRLLGEGVELVQLPICCGDGRTRRDEGPVWFIPYEGEARLLAARVSFFGENLADGRRVSTVDIGGDWRGVLQLSDPETGEALRIDDGVFAQMYVATEVFGDDVVVYSVPRGERAGVWIARMPPA